MKHDKNDWQFREQAERMRVLQQLTASQCHCSLSLRWAADDLSDPDVFGPEVYGYESFAQIRRRKCRDAMDALCATRWTRSARRAKPR